MFNLHVIQAKFGDCLLLEYGNGIPKYILIDGGPRDVYEPHLKKELQRIMNGHNELEVLVVSHVDADHIVGIQDLLADLKSQADAGDIPYLKIKDLWMNTFSSTLDPDDALANRMENVLETAGAQGVNMTSTGVAFLGVKEGHKLTQFCGMLGIPMNEAAAKDIFRVGSPNADLLYDNLTFTIVGPTKENLEELQLKWEEWLEEREEEIGEGRFNVLSMSDKSVPNLSSIMFLVEGDGKTVLFTGDGRGDHLLEGLKKKKLLKDGRLHVDVLKVAHHGSDRNTTRGFFESVTADKYVISADGLHGNPDYATLLWLVEAAQAQGRSMELYITNETPSTKKITQDYPPDEYNYTVTYIANGESSMLLEL